MVLREGADPQPFFTQATFELLAGLRQTPTKDFYNALAQAMAYADTQGCDKAILVYPSGTAVSITRVGHNVRRGTFDLSGDLERAGHAFLADVVRFVEA